MTTREFQQKKPLSILFTYFKPHRGLFILDLVCATVVALIDLAFPLVTRKSMYDLLPNQQYRTFFIVMGVMMAAFIVRALLYYVISYWGHTFGILVEADIRHDLFTHVQELDVSFFDHNRTGQLMSRLTSDLFEITELAHHGPEDLLISTLTIVGALAVMFTIEWRLALVVCVILPILLIVVIGGIGSVSGSCIASFLYIACSEWWLRFLDNEAYIGAFKVPLLRNGFRMFTRFDNNLVTLVHCFPHDASLLLVRGSNQRFTLLFQFGELGVCLTCHFQRLVYVGPTLFHHFRNDGKAVFGQYHKNHAE